MGTDTSAEEINLATLLYVIFFLYLAIVAVKSMSPEFLSTPMTLTGVEYMF
jgi:hypothetical protein